MQVGTLTAVIVVARHRARVPAMVDGALGGRRRCRGRSSAPTCMRHVVRRGPPARSPCARRRARTAHHRASAIPSGHTTIAAALVAVRRAEPAPSGRAGRSGRWRSLVAIARVYVGAHLPLDVIGGFALGCRDRRAGQPRVRRAEPGHRCRCRAARARATVTSRCKSLTPIAVHGHDATPYVADRRRRNRGLRQGDRPRPPRRRRAGRRRALSRLPPHRGRSAVRDRRSSGSSTRRCVASLAANAGVHAGAAGHHRIGARRRERARARAHRRDDDRRGRRAGARRRDRRRRVAGGAVPAGGARSRIVISACTT